jgi:mRNA interferase MazF
MDKDFDAWNKIKKAINALVVPRGFHYRAREVWWCATGLNVGVETDGKRINFERPVLIVRKFNEEMFWGVPLTSKARHGPFYQKISHETGVSWAMLSQLRTFSSKRLLRKVEMISENEFIEVQKKLNTLLVKHETPP